MARIWTGYPITAVHGNFGSGEFAMNRGDILLRPRKPTGHRKHEYHFNPAKQECKNHKWADLIYQMFTPAQVGVWRRALKAPHKSAYDLWMMECLYLFNRGLSSPLEPSVSGGYTGKKAIPGGPYNPPNW